nr:kynurenine formamidase isoform X2 [Paramormyrops kingsleyae]
MLIRIHSLGFKLGEAVLAPDELKATVFADDCASEAIRQVRVSKSSSGMFCLTACNMATWKEMKRDELCRQYSPSQWSHRMSADEVIKAHEASLREGTERARSITQTLLNVPYGEGQREKLDVYVPTNPSLEMPLVMYLHGGYWEALSKEESGFMAVPLVQKGVAVVAVDYDIAPGGNMDLMVSQVRQSVVSVVQQYAHIRYQSMSHDSAVRPHQWCVPVWSLRWGSLGSDDPVHRLVSVRRHPPDQRCTSG